MLFWSQAEINLIVVFFGSTISQLWVYTSLKKEMCFWLDIAYLVLYLTYEYQNKVRIYYMGLGIPVLIDIIFQFVDFSGFLRVLPLLNRVIPIMLFHYFGLYYKFEKTGPYQVGFKDEGAGAIYYPGNPKNLKYEQTYWLRENTLALRGFWKAWTFGKENTWWEEFRFRDMLKYTIPVYNNAKIHEDFTIHKKKIVPIICSPGIMGTRTLLSSIGIELASYGLYVVCIEHTDKSSGYYKDIQTGKYEFIETFPMDKPKLEETYRQKQMEHRIAQVGGVINKLKLNKELIFDMNKLGIIGHSFGGMTALEANYRIPDITFSIALDPYTRTRWRELLTNKSDFVLKTPFLIINSAIWHDTSIFTKDFKSYLSVAKIYSICECKMQNPELKSSNELLKMSFNLSLRRSDHCNFIDFPLIMPSYGERDGLIPKAKEVPKLLNQTGTTIMTYLSDIGVVDFKCEEHYLDCRYIKKV